MTTNELFDKITSEPKWYAGKLSAQSASNIKKKHKSVKYSNYEWFFGLFGYIKEPYNWVKIDYVFIDEASIMEDGSIEISYEINS